MEAPPLQYARTSDGVHIAYFRIGSGPPVVWASGIYGDAFMYRKGFKNNRDVVDGVIAAGRSVVLYDIRGMGASDKPVDDLSLDARVRDVEAVVAALRLKQFDMAALDLGGVTAIAYAARHPEAVSRLLLLEPWASGPKKAQVSSMKLTFAGNPEPGDDWLVWTNVLGSIVTGFKDHALGRQLADAIKDSCSPAQNAAYRRATAEIEVVDLLPKVTAPCLVVHYSDTVVGSLELASEVASGLQDSRFLIEESSMTWPAIHAFLREDTAHEVSQLLEHGLSRRELEVLRLIAAGRTNPQIAEELVISLNTVQRHVSSIFAKTGAANRTEAAVDARNKGLA